MPPPPRSLAESDRLYPFPAFELRRLPDRLWILEYVARGGVGAEVGVFRGHFSEQLLEHLEPRKAYFVDPWRLTGAHFGFKGPYTNDDTLPTAVAYQDAQWRTQRFEHVDRRFVEARFPCPERFDEPLDWLYLDASHKYQETLAELEAAAALLAPRGILFGDDWAPNPDGVHHGVFQAVNEFVRRGEWDFIAAGPAGQWALRRRAAWEPSAHARQQHGARLAPPVASGAVRRAAGATDAAVPAPGRPGKHPLGKKKAGMGLAGHDRPAKDKTNKQGKPGKPGKRRPPDFPPLAPRTDPAPPTSFAAPLAWPFVASPAQEPAPGEVEKSAAVKTARSKTATGKTVTKTAATKTAATKAATTKAATTKTATVKTAASKTAPRKRAPSRA